MNVYLTDSDKEAIVDFAKDHEELYNKTNKHFKDKAMTDCLWERFASSSKLSVKVCKTWSPKDSLWKLNTIQVWPGSQGNVREVYRTGFRTNLILSKSSGFKSAQTRASAYATSAHDISRGSTDTNNMETSIHSRHQPSICSTSSTSVFPQPSSVNQRVMDQFAQMETMLTSSLGPRQETTRTAFCKLPGI